MEIEDPFTPHDLSPALIFHVSLSVGDRTAADPHKRDTRESTVQCDNTQRPTTLAASRTRRSLPGLLFHLLLLRLNDVYSSTPWCTTACTRESRPSRDSLSVVADGRVLRAHAYPVASFSSPLAGTTVKQRRGPLCLGPRGNLRG